MNEEKKQHRRTVEYRHRIHWESVYTSFLQVNVALSETRSFGDICWMRPGKIDGFAAGSMSKSTFHSDPLCGHMGDARVRHNGCYVMTSNLVSTTRPSRSPSTIGHTDADAATCTTPALHRAGATSSHERAHLFSFEWEIQTRKGARSKYAPGCYKGALADDLTSCWPLMLYSVEIQRLTVIHHETISLLDIEWARMR